LTDHLAVEFSSSVFLTDSLECCCALQWQTLYKLVESWRQKEVDRQETVRHLQLEKHAVQEAFESQQQVSLRLEACMRIVLIPVITAVISQIFPVTAILLQ